jgi:enoyl-CoA hydratase
MDRIRTDSPAAGVARITLARAEQRNAQDRQMLAELDAAFTAAMADDAVKVVILAADGPDFSSGHDLADFAVINGMTVDEHIALERDIFLGYCQRWRDLPKPTIAQVQGRVIAGGLMLVWPCDLIIAAEDARFSDPVVAFGVNGHEFFVHAWELGHRKAKELLFRGTALTAQECEALGMVNHVVPLDELEARTLEIAVEIAARPAIGLRLAKESVNGSLDAQGQLQAIEQAFALHQIGHAHARVEFQLPIDPSGVAVIRSGAR